ncbi:MAG: glycosyltransferase family 2 protein [Leptodesmis sp.]|uniref:glycosyltransferase family 2 protein n=1 Tax=Leptodesmis sp. TaxID=3100501 RepID=UPI003D0BA453
MTHTQPFEQTAQLSFSVIVETENLSSAELDGLCRSLDSIAAQDLPPATAREVLILESGDVPQELIDRLSQDYSWLTIRSIEADTDYYAAKMKGVALTTGEIIVFADSDCIYEPNWLSSLLRPFSEDDSIQVVAGETRTSAAGPYALGISLTYIFPPFSEKDTLEKTSYYFCNNVAFRRQFLLQQPIPTEMAIYRGNCSIHASSFTKQGTPIWKQPQARACHAAPNGKAHFFWRYLLLGYDALMIYRLRRTDGKEAAVHPIADLFVCLALALLKVKVALQRLITLLIEQPGRLVYLPLAIPIALASLLLFWAGLAIAYFHPAYFLSPSGRVEVSWETS